MKSSEQRNLSSPGEDRTLVIMAKAPHSGMVKTRLTPTLPAPAVTAFYRCLLDDTLTLARSLSGVHVAVMCPESHKDELMDLLGSAVDVVAQKGEGLAAALTSVFAHFSGAVEQRVIAFNSDSPHLPHSVLEDAFETLAAHDVVVGPTHDGGYYLVGAKRSYPTLFAGDGMGTRSALDRLLARTEALGLSTGFTESFYDIDVANDLIRLAHELQLAPEKAPRTAAWFSEWEPAIAPLRARLGEL